jgi:mRNA-degrading endonuclease RelE of RelBE toxin-antitoxin system
VSKIVFLKKAEKDLKKIAQNEVRRIFTKISTNLADNPGKHKELGSVVVKGVFHKIGYQKN